MKPFLLVLLTICCALSGCATEKKVDLAAEEASIRKTDAAWLAASAAHDLDHVVHFWSDDATILPPGQPAIAGKDAIRKYVAGAFATPEFSISWTTDKIEISQSGDLAYSSGTDRISFKTPDGKTVTEENRGVAIWKKQPDGSWKCVLDVMVPAPAADKK